MKLYGSTTSPFVRRLRAFFEQHQIDYELCLTNIFGDDRAEVKKLNPTLKVPMLVDESNIDCSVFTDSGLIQQYVSQKNGILELSWQRKNLLNHIDACNDSLVNMMILKRSSVDTTKDKLYFNLQRERQLATFDMLETEVKKGSFQSWDYTSLALLVLIEWAQFRDLFDFSQYPALLNFIEQNQQQPGVQETKPKD